MKDFDLYQTVYGNKWVINTSQGGNPEDNNIVKSSEWHYNSEIQHILKIVDSLPNDAVIVDGGANLGFITVPLAMHLRNKGSNARIVSFEAQRRLFYALAGTVALNDLYNVLVYNQALGEEIAVAHMPSENYSDKKDFGCVHVSGTEQTHYNYLDTFNTQMVTIDSLNLPRLDFLKLDIETYEPQALRGGLNTIGKHRPWIWVEFYDCISVYNQYEIKSILEPLGNYSFYYLLCDNQNMLCIPNEKKHTVELNFLRTPV